MDEFAIIDKFFARQPVQREDVVIGIGDDAAVTAPRPGKDLVCTTDMLVRGVHFPESTDPYAVGYKALAVNLSDLAAMGAQPAWLTLSLSLPDADPKWIEAFSTGFHELAGVHQLIGGDLVRGPMTVCVQAMGYVDSGRAVCRSGAHVGDDIYVSGYVGDACLGLKALNGELSLADVEKKYVVDRLHYPSPRVVLGQSIKDIAHAAIDLSDGLYKDLGHITFASEVAAQIDLDLLPISETYSKHKSEIGWEPALCGGDDYELCIITPAGMEDRVEAIGRRHKVPIKKIGTIISGEGVKVTRDGTEYVPKQAGYDHFA